MGFHIFMLLELEKLNIDEESNLEERGSSQEEPHSNQVSNQVSIPTGRRSSSNSQPV